jgi:hypothetical protein
VIHNDPAVDVAEAARPDTANADDEKILDAFARKLAAQQEKEKKK